LRGKEAKEPLSVEEWWEDDDESEVGDIERATFSDQSKLNHIVSSTFPRYSSNGGR